MNIYGQSTETPHSPEEEEEEEGKTLSESMIIDVADVLNAHRKHRRSRSSPFSAFPKKATMMMDRATSVTEVLGEVVGVVATDVDISPLCRGSALRQPIEN